MNTSGIARTTAVVITILLSAGARATQDPGERSRLICEEVMANEKGGVVARHDGLSPTYAAQGLKDAIEARDVLHSLGVPTPPHQIIYAPERQLNILAATGLLPAPHAIAGAHIFQSINSKKSLGILEFAQPGGQPASIGPCATCRSYYSNMTAIRDQRPIYLHVGGHNHVFTRSLFFRMRNVDPIAASDLFAKEMEDQYEREGFEPVSLFFHYLYPLLEFQDFTNGTFDDPDSLSPDKSKPQEINVRATGGNWDFLREQTTVKQYPWESSPSVLQFLAGNTPSHIAPFKQDLIRKYEMMVRSIPAVSQQKLVHEAWATYLMVLGQAHSNWTSDRDIVDFARVVQGAVGKTINVDNPYSFGFHAVDHLFRKFKRRPEVQSLSEKALAISFVQDMDKQIVTMSDGEFVTRVVDEEFVTRHHLSLAREGSKKELAPVHEKLIKQGVPTEKLPNGVIISKSADRIRRHLVRRIGMKVSPQLRVLNPKLSNPFQVNLEQTNIENAPLEPNSAAQMLFALTQVSELPVSATFLLSERWLGVDVNSAGVIPARMEVRPDGRVRVFKRNTLDSLAKDAEETEQPQLATRLQQAVEYYKTDQSFSFSEKILEEDRKRWEQMFPAMIDKEVAEANLESLGGLVDYAPTAARAITLFGQLLKDRFAKQMEAAFQGKLRMKFGPNGVKLPLIPMTPHLMYDRTHLSAEASKMPPAPMDSTDNRVANLSIAPDADDGSLIGSVPGSSVGDGITVPSGGEGGGGGTSQSDDDGTPQEIEIPANLFRQILAKNFEIPNPRETDGETPMMRELRMGERRDSSEEPMWEKMAGDALVKAIVARRAKGDKSVLGKVSPAQLIREGFAMLDEEDYIIRSKRDIPLPSFDAVVVVDIDLSASMQGPRLELVRNVVYNIRELFRAIFPNVVFHFVGFDDKAEEYPEEKIWGAYRAGATKYAPALDKTQEILKRYPRDRWNHYVLFAGDSELMDLKDFMKKFKEYHNDWQYFGLIVTQDPGTPPDYDADGLRKALNDSKSEWPWVRETLITDIAQLFQTLGDLFDKKK